MAQRQDILSIEAASQRAWPPIAVEPFHGWELRYGGAQSRRLDSVRTLAFDDSIALEDAVARVEAWYDAFALPSCFQVTDVTQPAALDAVLATRGYEPLSVTVIQWVDLARVPAPSSQSVQLLGEVTPTVLDALCAPEWNDRVRLARRALLCRIRPARRFAVVEVDGQVAAGGLCVADGPLAGIFSMRTHPAYRGRGLARAVLLRLADWARSRGAQRLYLQVEEDNLPATSLYTSVGFSSVYRYHYRERPRR